MVKLPIYEQQVQPDTQVIPSAPKNTGNPGLVLSSMNKNAEAVQGAAAALGDVGQKLYAHAQKLQTLQLKKKNAEFDTQFRQELQDKLYSPDEETVTVNGQDITRPKGIYNRSLKQAEGSRAEFEDYYATTRQKYLSQVSDPEAQLALANSLDNQFYSARDNVYSHESKQMREDLVNGFKSNISQQIKDAANSTDLRSLTESVNTAVDTQKSLNDALGLDAATAKLAEQKTIADVIESSTSAALMKDMSGATSMKLLDAAKDVLDQKDYDELASGIKVKSKKILDETKANAKLGKNINSTKILMEVADGNFSVFNVKELNRMANNGEISNEAATAAIRAIEKPISDYDIKPDDEAFMQRVKGIFEASNPEDMEKNLIDVLDGFSSGSLSQDKMTLLFQAAKGQGSEKATAYRENFKKIYDWGVDAGVPVTYQSQVAKDYVEGINAGKDPVEAAEVAIKRASASQNEGVGAEAVRVSDNPKDNIGFSDRVMTSPVMNTLFEGLTKFSQNRAVKVIGLGQAGMVEGVGGAAKLVGLKDFGEAVSKEAKLMQKTFEIKDPKFLDKLGMGASSSLSFFVPGLAVAKGVTMLKAAPIIAVALGVSTSSVLESSIEAGGNYEEAKRRGMTDEQAKQVGGVTFWLNMPLLIGTNVLGGLFNPEGQAIKQAGKKMTVDRIIKAVAEKGIKPAVAEGTQEGLQQVSQNVAIGDPALEGAREAAVIGAIVGGGLGAVMHVADNQGGENAGKAGKTPINDGPKDNIVRDKDGKPLEINTEKEKVAREMQALAEQVAVKKGVVASALAGVETISNNGNSKEVALNTAISGNLEIINGFSNADSKIDAAKNIDKAVYEYFMQSGMPKEDAAMLSKQIYDSAVGGKGYIENPAEYKNNLITAIEGSIPTWRFTAPNMLSNKEVIVIGGDLVEKSKQGQNGQEKVLTPMGADTAPAVKAPVPIDESAIKSTVEQAGGKFKTITDMANSVYEDEPTIYFDDQNGLTKTIRPSQVSVENVKKKMRGEAIAPTVQETPKAKHNVAPTGTREESGIAKSLEAKAIEKGLTESFGDIAEFDPTTIKEQSEMMAKIMSKDIERAKRLATGKEQLPEGLKGITAWKAMEDYAMTNNDGQLALELAQSPIASENSQAGQTLSLTRGRTPDTATAKIQEIKKARESVAQKKLKSKNKADVKKGIDKAIKDKVEKAKPTKKNFEEFLNEIAC